MAASQQAGCVRPLTWPMPAVAVGIEPQHETDKCHFAERRRKTLPDEVTSRRWQMCVVLLGLMRPLRSQTKFNDFTEAYMIALGRGTKLESRQILLVVLNRVKCGYVYWMSQILCGKRECLGLRQRGSRTQSYMLS
jgi:hypothetical protein